MKNVIVVIFSDEGKTYEVLSTMKNWSGSTKVLSGCVIKNTGEGIVVKDGFDFENDASGWASGGLIGSLIGLISGPLGMLLGGSIGALIGLASDDNKVVESEKVINQVISKLDNYKLALILVVEEPNINEINNFLDANDCAVFYRHSFSQVEQEVKEAEKLQKELAREARKKLQ